jgi:hypothetical protein
MKKIDIDNLPLPEIKLSDYSCTSTCTSVEAEPLDLDKLTKAMKQIREEHFELEKKRLWTEMTRFNYRPSFANPFTFGIKVMS